MGLVGSLEDLGLGDILQIVSLSRKAGVLNLSWGEVKGKILFSDGQVVAATSTANKRDLANLLAQHGHVSEARVEALNQQINSIPDAAGIKAALVNEHEVPRDVLDEAVRQQIESVVYHFFSWPEGIFSFELQEIDADIEALEPPDHAFVLEVGLSPQFLAMEGTRIQDEFRRRKDVPVGPPITSAPPAMSEPPPAPEIAADTEPAAPAELTAPVPDSAGSMPAGSEENFDSVADAVAYYEAKTKEQEVGEQPMAVPDQAPQHDNLTSTETESGLSDSSDASPDQPPGPAPAHPLSPVPAIPVSWEPADKPTPEPEKPAAGAGPELVIVDDDSFMLVSMSHHLEAKGYRTRVFDEVPSALKHIREAVDTGNRPSAVLVDLIMPDSTGNSTLGGLEVLENTRNINPAISVYLMSDYENAPARKRSEEMGARFFFMKPKSSQLDDDYSSPELINFISVVENALQSEQAVADEPEAARGEDLVNLGEELRREFGEDVKPIHPEIESLTPSRGLHMLKAMISELNDPNASGQITLLVLRFAAELMNRAVIFLVAKNQLAGLGQFGIVIDGADPQEHVRKIRIPLNQPSIFREAIQKRLPLKKSLKETKWNDRLVEGLGGTRPTEVFVAPIIAGGKIAAILYGDNVPEQKEIGDTESLEIFLVQAGLAMEKALLERRLREMGTSP